MTDLRLAPRRYPVLREVALQFVASLCTSGVSVAALLILFATGVV